MCCDPERNDRFVVCGRRRRELPSRRPRDLAVADSTHFALLLSHVTAISHLSRLLVLADSSSSLIVASESSFSMAGSPTWPPSSLADMNVHNLVNHCEGAEMNSATCSQPFLALTHLCALLYVGEYVHVRHLMRRCSGHDDDELLQEWWHTVACPILENNPTRAMQGLEHCSSHNPAPFSRYAAEIAAVYLQRKEDEKDGGRTPSSMDAASAPVVSFLETWSA